MRAKENAKVNEQNTRKRLLWRIHWLLSLAHRRSPRALPRAKFVIAAATSNKKMCIRTCIRSCNGKKAQSYRSIYIYTPV